MTAEKTYRPLLEILTDGRQLPDGFDAWGFRAVHPDFTSSHGYRWPYPGHLAVAPGPIIDHRRSCPRRAGDGICVATTAAGMASGGIPANAVLLTAHKTGDVIGDCEAGKLRLASALVVDLVWLRRLDLSGADLSRAHLSGADLSDADLSGADLSDADLSGANLSGANLSGANLSGANLADAYLNDAYLTRANLSGANLSDANLADANLDGANMTGAYLTGANLTDANLADANLTGANLDGANLADAYLGDANLTGANLGDWVRGDNGFARKVSASL